MIQVLDIQVKEVRRLKFPMWTVIVNGVEVLKFDRWSQAQAQWCADRLKLQLASELLKRASESK